jgi:predicted CopG family antitoxin
MSVTIRIDPDVHALLKAERRPFPEDRNWSDVLRRLLDMPKPNRSRPEPPSFRPEVLWQ